MKPAQLLQSVTTSLGVSRFALVLHVGAILPILMLGIYLLVFLPRVPAVAVLRATADMMTYRVAIPEMSRLSLRGYALSYEAPVSDLGFAGDHLLSSKTTKRALCLEGLFTPDAGTQIIYERFNSDPIAVELRRDDGKPVGAFEITKGTVPEAIRKASWIRLAAKADDDGDKQSALSCPGTPNSRLPVYGLAEIGSEIRPPSFGEKPSYGTLLDGTLDILAHTIDLHALETAPRVYPASSVTIPAGSKIFVINPEDRQRPWVGFVMPDSSSGLDVRLTTESKNIALVRPGAAQPEIISIGLFTQLTNDPTLVSAQLTVAFLFSIFQLLGSLASRIERHKNHC